ncbi:hypothetical protein [Leptolyngbya sp. KIOST-1]|uniref:hypothetical protein n=1 Tax=Leptolyngbya sp. KIOST-1 TaxID=1229172 RepID=UPI0012E0735F|nr:hypothetical protein [Leptolyngbya sp. KIOST-1]
MATINTKLIDSLAQVILALSAEEQRLLGRKLRHLGGETQQPSQFELEQFFQTLGTLPLDPEQPSLEAISDIVKDVRRDLWPAE